MKRTIKVFGIAALAALIGLSIASCDFLFDDDENNDASLNGAWIRVSQTGGTGSIGTVDTIIDSDGYFTKVDGGWESVMNKGNIKIGDLHFRNITKTGERTWSYENLLFNQSTYDVTVWSPGTITLSADGNTFITDVPASASTNTTYTRVQNNNNLDGAWIRVSQSGGTSSIGTVDTIIGRDGYFTKVDGGWESVMNKGNIKIGDLHFRNITKTGERTWSYQNQLYNTETFVLTKWADGTITLSADGQSFTTIVPDSSSQNTTYNRVK